VFFAILCNHVPASVPNDLSPSPQYTARSGLSYMENLSSLIAEGARQYALRECSRAGHDASPRI